MSKFIKADLHSHTHYSILRIPRLKGDHFFQDSTISPKLLVKLARRKKLDAIAITDHDNMNGVKPFLHYASKYKDIIPIIGQEVTKYDQKGHGWAHVLTYGLKKIPWEIRFKPLPEFLEYLDDNNAVYVLAHPFDLSQSAPAGGYDRKTFKIKFSVLKRFGMIEVVNGLQPKRHNYLAQIIARELELPGIAGGDNHHRKMVGRCYTFVEGSNEEEILEFLRKVKKSPSKYNLKTVGTGSHYKIWSDWFTYLLQHLEYNIRYDIYRHLNLQRRFNIKDPVYDRLFFDTPMLPKILIQAALPYLYWGLQAGLKIWAPSMEQRTTKKELYLFRSLIDYQGINENHQFPSEELPYPDEELLLL